MQRRVAGAVASGRTHQRRLHEPGAGPDVARRANARGREDWTGRRAHAAHHQTQLGAAARARPDRTARLTERAHQDRDITYFLQEPSTNSFSLFHDYTESRPGIDKYINVVRTGSHVSNPSAYILDTGETLRQETLKGAAITVAKIDAGTVTPDTEVVVVHFPP